MTYRPVRIIPDPVLLQKAEPVTDFDAAAGVLDDMLDTMYGEAGIGLAGNQIGVLQRLAVVDVSEERGGAGALKMVNPEIVSLSGEQDLYAEGCLSIPGVNREVMRPIAGAFRYYDTYGQMHELEADGLLARCIQHEIDHLNGVLFIDHLSKLKRHMIWKSFVKKAKAS